MALDEDDDDDAAAAACLSPAAASSSTTGGGGAVQMAMGSAMSVYYVVELECRRSMLVWIGPRPVYRNCSLLLISTDFEVWF